MGSLAAHLRNSKVKVVSRLRSSARFRRAAKLWKERSWQIIVVLWLLVLVLGFEGFRRYAAAQSEARSISDLIYLTLQLLTLESGSVDGQANPALNVARFLAPFLAAVTATKALAAVWHEKTAVLRVRLLYRDHVVICGLGERAFLLVQEFMRQDDRVVVIEEDETNSLVEECKELGAVVIIGDARESHILAKANVAKARRLVSLCGDDGTNAEIGTVARELCIQDGGSGLTCLIHIYSPQLCDLLRNRMMEKGPTSAFKLEFFNIFQVGAWTILDSAPAFSSYGETAQTEPHAVVIGMGRMGETMVVGLEKLWRKRRPRPDARMTITLIDRAAVELGRSLVLRNPRLVETCRLRAADLDVQTADFIKHRKFFSNDSVLPPTAVYVCLSDQGLGLTTALNILDFSKGSDYPIVLRLNREGGLSTLIPSSGDSSSAFARLYSFGLLERTCTTDLIHGVSVEVLARAIHAHYVETQARAGRTRHDNPTMVPWDELSPELKDSNRRQAEHVREKLDRIGCSIAPIAQAAPEPFVFTEEEVEQLARMEHERWMAEKREQGWSYGPEKDLENKRSPALVNWEELDDVSKEYNRESVHELPELLALIDLQLYRLQGENSTQTTNAENRAHCAADSPPRKNAMYEPKPIDTTAVELPDEILDLAEKLAENTHDLWSQMRFENGWSYGPHRDDANKKHPCLVPYADLPEEEKQYDRVTALQTLKAIIALGFTVRRPDSV